MKQSQNVHRKKLPLGLVRRYPAASILGVWVTLVLLGGLSTAALINVNNSKAAKASQVPSVEPSLNSETLVTQPSPANPSQPGSLWLSFGAIALTCTVGCLVFFQTTRSTGYQPVRRKTQVKSSTPAPLAEIDRQESLASSPRSQPEASSNAPPLVKSVTVVPKQQNHPLDWDEPSLADSLDMRQRRPLSHWL
jgi:hypothetical protein